MLFYVSRGEQNLGNCQKYGGTVRSTCNSHAPWDTEVTALFVPRQRENSPPFHGDGR